ncbi:MAG: glycosyltransferase family 2 protein [Lachnospiraceae bacterium]|nr:glycosyltransferase family 2 protein [Lachnospiraceae bacterium]
MKDIKLSQCMIVKNEEDNIRRALSWGKSIVWEQIVVDTGSSDRTMELAKELGAKVFHFPWCDDFSAAKNYAIEQAKGDWIIFLDADEYFEPECARKIPELIRHAENDFPEGKKPDMIRAALQNLDDTGRTFMVGEQNRIFRNRSDIRYRDPIHEFLCSKTGKPLLWMQAVESLSIMHTGYKSSVIQKKGERNLPLLRKQAEREPENPEVWCYLAESLAGAGRITEARLAAEHAFSYALKQGEYGNNRTGSYTKETAAKRGTAAMKGPLAKGLPIKGLTGERFGELCALWLTLAKDETPQTALDLAGPAYQYYGEFRRTGLVNPDVDFAMGNYLAKVGLKEDAIRILEGAFETLERWPGGASLRLTGGVQRACNYLAACALEKGQTGRAVSWLTLSLRTDRYQEEALATLLGLFKDDPNTNAEQEAAFLGRLYHLAAGKEGLKDRLFVLKSALAKSDRELAELIRRNMSEEERLWLDTAKKKPWLSGREELKESYPQIPVRNRMDLNFLSLMQELSCRPADELGEGEYGEATAELLKTHRDAFLRLYAKLGEYRSRQVLYGILEMWLGRERRSLALAGEPGVPGWDLDLIPTAEQFACANVGARLKESTEGFLYCYEDMYETFTCFSESGEESAELSRYRDVSVLQAALSTLCLDEAYGKPLDLLRFDAGLELLSLLKGSERHIRENHSRLILSLEKNLNSLYELPNLLLEWNPDYRLYLRYYGTEQAGQLVLFAV